MQMCRRVPAAVCLLCFLTQIVSGQSIGPEREPATRVYRADESPDPAVARDVAIALGKGRHVVTRLHAGKTYRGHITSIDPAQLTIRLDHKKGLLVVPYAEIAYLEQNLTKAAKVWIGIGIGVGAVLGALIIWAEVCCE